MTKNSWNYLDKGEQLDTCKCNIESVRQESVKFLYKLRLTNKRQKINTKNSAETIYQNGGQM